MDRNTYWQKRQEQTFLAGEKRSFEVAKKLKSNYKKCYNEIEKQINILFGKYANKEGLTYSQAKKLLNRNELKSFNENLNDLIDLANQENLDNSQINKLRLLKYKTNISRLQELQTNIEFELNKLTNNCEKEIKDLLYSEYEEAYYRTAYNKDQFLKISSTFTGLNRRAIDTAIKTKYLDTNYSSALWTNKNKLMTILNNEIPRGLTLGYNPNKLASMVSKKLDTNFNNTVRLIRTEYNLILNQATFDGYEACDIDRYQILATLDDRTSEICQDMDLQIYELSEKEVGITYPPFHPNCRTTTIPYFEPDEFDKGGERIAKDEEGNRYYVPDNLSYKEWKASLIKKSNDKVRYKGGD